jgi:hypothetical protein
MTTGQTPRPDASRNEPGYRGALPTRNDRLARPWILTVLGIFVLILVLSVLGVPSRFFPEPTPVPLPSLPASGSVEPSASISPSASVSASASPSAEASPTP